jgi:hypothetical protein
MNLLRKSSDVFGFRLDDLRRNIREFFNVLWYAWLSFVLVVAMLVLLFGCAQLAGLPDAEHQLRIFEGDAMIEGGTIASPVDGAASGHGCIVSQLGQVDAAVLYQGEKCTVSAPCEGCARDAAARSPPE